MAKPIVLIHGAWHGSWCWSKVTSGLQSYQKVINVDLPGHGDTHRLFRGIDLNVYVNYLIQVIHQLKEPVILVGHSFAGVIISQLGENIPEFIDQLIYVTAFMPLNGESLTDESRKMSSPGVSTELIINLKKNEVALKQSERLKALFYNQCTDKDANFAMTHLQNEPYRPFVDTVKLTSSRFGQLKKTYIACSNDKVVPLFDQKRMYEQHGCHALHIDADHSPFFSTPELLVQAILNCS